MDKNDKMTKCLVNDLTRSIVGAWTKAARGAWNEEFPRAHVRVLEGGRTRANFVCFTKHFVIFLLFVVRPFR